MAQHVGQRRELMEQREETVDGGDDIPLGVHTAGCDGPRPSLVLILVPSTSGVIQSLNDHLGFSE